MLVIDNISWVVGTAAIVPALIVLWLVVATDRRPEPLGTVILAVLLGTASCLLLRYLPLPLGALAGDAGNPWLGLFVRTLLAIAVPEETVKLLAIAIIITFAPAFDEPMDGIVYGAAVGLGFAGLENLGYLTRHVDDLAALATIRGLLTVPFHAALGAIAGAAIAVARFSPALSRSRGRRLGLYALAGLIPMLSHALFDTFLLALRQPALISAAGETLVQIAGLVTGLLTILAAAQIAARLAGRQQPSAGRGALLERLRAGWADVLAGSLAGFTGAALLLMGLRPLVSDGDASPASLIGAAVLLVAAGLMLRRARHRWPD